MGKTILVVEDDCLQRTYLDTLLSGEGYKVHLAENGITALQKVEQVNPDLITLDDRMPGMLGTEVCRRLKEDPKYMHIPILMITANTLPGDIEKYFAAGANGYLSKPYLVEDLVKKVQELLPNHQ